MLVPWLWLCDFLDLADQTPESVAQQLTVSGIEVAAIRHLDAEISQVVIGQILEVIPHPNADHLYICRVDCGDAVRTIVTGAPNARAGAFYPVALPGARLPGGRRIEPSVLRGVRSEGMICSAQELGFEENVVPKEIADGLWLLETPLPVGRVVQDALWLNDTVLDLDLTYNRSDCLSILGVAYEVAALLGRQVHVPQIKLSEEEGLPLETTLSIELQTSSCSAYAARCVEGVSWKASPLSMQHRLMAAGIRPISAVVDVTNYVMLEFGQPLHAFDRSAIGSRIVVREARAGEQMQTLDGTLRQLPQGAVLITNGEVPVGVGGVMGGANSQIVPQTQQIILESARFEPRSVRETSRALGLFSEASLRFGRGVDPNVLLPALDRAAALLQEVAGGRIVPGRVVVGKATAEPVRVIFRPDRANALLGTDWSTDSMREALERLGFAVKDHLASQWEVTVPTRRADVAIEADLIEEVARIVGYAVIPTSLPASATFGRLDPDADFKRLIRETLITCGLSEVITYSLQSPEQLSLFEEPTGQVHVRTPMTAERRTLRTTLVVGLLSALRYNVNRNRPRVALFEVGQRFRREGGAFVEETAAAGVLWGAAEPLSWYGSRRQFDFFDAKGIVEALAARAGLLVDLQQHPHPGTHPGQAAEILLDGIPAGWVAALHPQVAQQLELPQGVMLFELPLSVWAEKAHLRPVFHPLSRFPVAVRDLDLVVDIRQPAAALQTALQQVGTDFGETKVTLFDVYMGPQVGEGRKALAFRIQVEPTQRSMTDQELQERVDQLLTVLHERFGATLRH
ncbi:MAG: phenylalanine--tRNA ligase subunit beta [Firmicutes bacterium]|nr:phenylalanine--tRNA ligase subunit beta [Bacillota bacterium]